MAILVSVLSVMFKELERMKLHRMDVSFKGLRAEFRPKDKDKEDA